MEHEDYEKSRSGINGLEERQSSQQKWKILPGGDIEMLSKTSSSLWPPLHKGQQGNEKYSLSLAVLAQGEGGFESTLFLSGL